jgi:hypothetical protein
MRKMRKQIDPCFRPLPLLASMFTHTIMFGKTGPASKERLSRPAEHLKEIDVAVEAEYLPHWFDTCLKLSLI